MRTIPFIVRGCQHSQTVTAFREHEATAKPGYWNAHSTIGTVVVAIIVTSVAVFGMARVRFPKLARRIVIARRFMHQKVNVRLDGLVV